MVFRGTVLVLMGLMLVGAMCQPRGEFDGGTGSMSGVVTDSATLEPLVGACILISNTTLGAVTGVNGYYKVPRIPPGSYTVSTTCIGYGRKDLFGVLIVTGKPTAIDVSLVAQAVLKIPHTVRD